LVLLTQHIFSSKNKIETCNWLLFWKILPRFDCLAADGKCKMQSHLRTMDCFTLQYRVRVRSRWLLPKQTMTTDYIRGCLICSVGGKHHVFFLFLSDLHIYIFICCKTSISFSIYADIRCTISCKHYRILNNTFSVFPSQGAQHFSNKK